MGYSDEVNATEDFNIIEENQNDIECVNPIFVDNVLNGTNNNLEEETIITTEEIQPELTEVEHEETESDISQFPEENVELFVQPEFVNVKIKFPNSATPIDCVSAATNCREKIVAANKQIRLFLFL